ncbi:NAD(P)-binding protein [Candidatus Methylopumilus universalis]|uniref:NAD(P)-binding protein n=1 Tax=Candidatus Methylopumilus universalis TaxID=2588536 RepID=UPI003BEEB91E
MKDKTCVVVGGGIVGLLAAYLAAKKFTKVILIEKSLNAGGLLGSFEFNGALYDYGTHFPSITNIDDLDQILYGTKNERTEKYEHFPYLKSENYFMGEWNLSSPLPSTLSLPREVYAQGIIELLEAPGSNPSELNFEKYLISTFGNTFTTHIYKPILKKLLNEDLGKLDKNVLKVFGIQRLIALTSEVTKDLKSIPKYNDCLGFHSYTDGAPTLPYCYPKGSNGIGFWSDELFKKTLQAGVEIKTSKFVCNIDLNNTKIKSVELNDGSQIKCDLVFWSISPTLALKAAGVKISSIPPKFRSHTLCHFEFEGPFLKLFPQYLLCWDVEMISYRITLYPNITKDKSKLQRYNLTVEVLSDASAETRSQYILEKVLDEIRLMKIVSYDNKVLASKVEYMGNSFPILTVEFIDNLHKMNTQINDNFSNLILLGRGSGGNFFINDLLIDTYNKLQTIAEDYDDR